MSGVASAGELRFLFIALAPNQWLLFGARCGGRRHDHLLGEKLRRRWRKITGPGELSLTASAALARRVCGDTLGTVTA